jgi:hypothetical protein
MNNLEGYLCLKCGRVFYTINTLENHAHTSGELFPEENPLKREAAFPATPSAVAFGISVISIRYTQQMKD